MTDTTWRHAGTLSGAAATILSEPQGGAVVAASDEPVVIFLDPDATGVEWMAYTHQDEVGGLSFRALAARLLSQDEHD